MEEILVRFGAPVVAGVGGGILTYFLQDSLAKEMQSQPAILPVIGAFASAGAVYFLMRATGAAV